MYCTVSQRDPGLFSHFTSVFTLKMSETTRKGSLLFGECDYGFLVSFLPYFTKREAEGTRGHMRQDSWLGEHCEGLRQAEVFRKQDEAPHPEILASLSMS